MNKQLIYKYINAITKSDISNYLKKEIIDINNNDIDIIYDYLKNNTSKVINHPLESLEIIKDNIDNNTYTKLLDLYNKYKYFIE